VAAGRNNVTQLQAAVLFLGACMFWCNQKELTFKIYTNDECSDGVATERRRTQNVEKRRCNWQMLSAQMEKLEKCSQTQTHTQNKYQREING